jgi:hypothetical protein
MSPLETSTVAPEDSLYPIDCEAARQLADATGIWTDLNYAVDELARLQGEIKRDPRDVVVERALWTSAVAHYGRCFVEGRRFQLSPTMFDGRYPAPVGAAEQHGFMMNLVDKDIRHPVSGFEQAHVGVLVARGHDGVPQIIHAAVMSARHHTRTTDGADKALRHTKALRDYVFTVIQPLHGEVEAYARQRPIGEIMKAGAVILEAPPIDAAGKSRKGAAVRSIPGLDA